MTIRAYLLGFILLFNFLNLSASPRIDRIEFYHGLAEGNYLIGDLKGAERGIEQMLRIDADHIPALTLKARVLFDQGRAEAALQTADRAITLDPGRLEIYLLKALILGHLERRSEAEAIVQSVIEQAAPQSDDARAAQQLRGLLLMAEGEWDAAAAAFDDIYLADPQSAATSRQLTSEAYLEKARTAMGRGAHDAAITAFDQAIDIYENQSGQESLRRRTELQLMRARLLTQIGRSEAAINDLQTLTAQQPDNFEALITLASLYASVGRWESLQAIIDPIAQRPELSDVALYLEGRSALAQDRVGTARAKFEAAINTLPKEADRLRRSLFFYRGLCLERLGRRQEAETQILNAIDAGFRPETNEEALLASRILLRADRAEEAIPILEAITLNRIDPGAAVWAMLGRAHIDAQTPTLALSALNESLRLQPEQAEARALRGSLLRKIGDLPGALADYQVARRLSPANATLAYAHGLVLLQLGHIDKAENALAEAAAELSELPGLHLLHALLAYTLGQHDAAEASLRNYQSKIRKNQNPTADYLRLLLQGTRSKAKAPDLIGQYLRGQASRKQVLDGAGLAETPGLARKQICAAAFWMAQYERSQGEFNSGRQLLNIAIEMGRPDLTEYQLADWQLAKDSAAVESPD